MSYSGRAGATVIPFPGQGRGTVPAPSWIDAVTAELATGSGGDGSLAFHGVPSVASYMARLLADGRADAVAAGPAHADLHLEVLRDLAHGRPVGRHGDAVARLVLDATGRAREATRAMLAMGGRGTPVARLPEHAAWAAATRAEFAVAALAACVRGDPAAATCATLLAAARMSGGNPDTVGDRAAALRMALGRHSA